MNKIKGIVRKYWKIVAAYAASIYGTTFTTLCGMLIITDDLWASERLECAVMMTCLPAMIYGVHALKEHWIAKALSKQTRELTVVETADKAA